MATTYIKLNPPLGDAFASKELGLYLVPGNASEIDEAILNNRLVNFLLTGFVVEISKLEYDNIKLLNSTTTNIPLNQVPVGQPYILEPVEDAVNTPPDSSIGKRYLVAQAVPGIFMSKKDYIAQSNGIDWDYIKPENGMILPVYAWGISLHYTGTYPSGSWDIPQERLDALSGSSTTPGSTDLETLIELLNAEIAARKAADIALQNLINGLPISTPFSGKAKDVSIQDSGNYWTSNNVENVLVEIAQRFITDEASISGLQVQLSELLTNGFAFQFLYGNGTIVSGDPRGHLNNIYLDVDTGNIYKKNGTTDADAAWVPIYSAPNSPPPNTVDYPINTSIPITIDPAEYADYGISPLITIKLQTGIDLTSQTQIDSGTVYPPTSIIISPPAGLADPTKIDAAITVIISKR